MTSETSSSATFSSVLVLHGGGGPSTVAGLAAHLGATLPTTAPTHPGWNGVALPDNVTSIADLADRYLAQLTDSGATDVLVVGSSLGGWIAAEMAVRDAPAQGGSGRIAGLVLIDSTGIEVPGEPIRDFFALDARGVAEYSWHDAERGYTDPASIPPEQLAIRAANMTTMAAIAGTMADPTLADRLAVVAVPSLVVWGESDRIVTPAYGRALAGALANSRFELISEAGHLPQLEQPAPTLAVIDAFIVGGL